MVHFQVLHNITRTELFLTFLPPSVAGLSGPWSSSPVDIAPAGLKTYNSQNTFDLAVSGTSQTSYIYMGDRWRVNVLGNSSYVWQRISFPSSGSGTPTLDYADVWSLDVSTGEAVVPQGVTFNANSGTITGTKTSKSADCAACPSKKIVTSLGSTSDSSLVMNGVRAPDGKAGKRWVSIYYVNADAYPKYRGAYVGVGNQDVGQGQSVEFPSGGSASR